MRDYKLFIPSDCVVSNTEEENTYALKQMKEILKATVLPASELDFEKLKTKQSAADFTDYTDRNKQRAVPGGSV
jgi:hypothetical protein